jgi:hypothetical protein
MPKSGIESIECLGITHPKIIGMFHTLIQQRQSLSNFMTVFFCRTISEFASPVSKDRNLWRD